VIKTVEVRSHLLNANTIARIPGPRSPKGFFAGPGGHFLFAGLCAKAAGDPGKKAVFATRNIVCQREMENFFLAHERGGKLTRPKNVPLRSVLPPRTGRRGAKLGHGSRGAPIGKQKAALRKKKKKKKHRVGNSGAAIEKGAHRTFLTGGGGGVRGPGGRRLYGCR